MARVKQFADDLGISTKKAKDLINKGRSRKDGGSQILEKVMKPKKYKDGGLGMQSVKFGIDDNPAITAADPKAKFIAKSKPVNKAKGGGIAIQGLGFKGVR